MAVEMRQAVTNIADAFTYGPARYHQAVEIEQDGLWRPVATSTRRRPQTGLRAFQARVREVLEKMR